MCILLLYQIVPIVSVRLSDRRDEVLLWRIAADIRTISLNNLSLRMLYLFMIHKKLLNHTTNTFNKQGLRNRSFFHLPSTPRLRVDTVILTDVFNKRLSCLVTDLLYLFGVSGSNRNLMFNKEPLI